MVVGKEDSVAPAMPNVLKDIGCSLYADEFGALFSVCITSMNGIGVVYLEIN
jgi:hypothetical protein